MDGKLRGRARRINAEKRSDTQQEDISHGQPIEPPLEQTFEQAPGQAKSFRTAVPAIILIFSIITLNILNRSILSPLLLPIEESLSISHGPAARIFLVMSYGYSLTLLLSGFVSAWLTHRGTLLASSGIMAVAMVMMSAVRNVEAMYITAFILGLGAGLYPASGLTILTSLVDKKDRQKALSIHEVGPQLGMVAAPLLANLLLNFTTWRGVLVIAALITAGTGINFFRRTAAVTMRGFAPTFSALLPLLRDRRFWILTLFFGLIIGSIQGMYSLIPTFLATEAGFSLKAANNIFGISRILPIISLLSAGMFMDKLGRTRSLALTFTLAGVSVLLMGILKGPFLIGIVFIQPAFSALFSPVGLSALSDIGPPESRNVVISMMLPPAILFGIGIIPAFLGYMGDHASFALGFVVLGCLVIGAAPLNWLLRSGKPGGAAPGVD